MMSTGRPSRSITAPIVAVFPVPVAPRSVTYFSPASMPSTIDSTAAGWSPAISNPGRNEKARPSVVTGLIGLTGPGYAGFPTPWCQECREPGLFPQLLPDVLAVHDDV